MKRSQFIVIARLLLVLVFTYAGVVKLFDPLSFADNVASYQILFTALINLFALGLPIYEITCGILLAFGIWLRGAALATSFLLTILTGSVIYAFLRGLPIQGGCLGTLSWLGCDLRLVILRDFILLGLSITLYASELKKYVKGKHIRLDVCR